MEVELLVFGGRPNPRWRLPASAVRELGLLLSQLSQPGQPRPPKLGYQGFVIYQLGPGGTRRPLAHVFGPTVTMLSGPRTVAYRDGAGIEAWLVARAEEAGMSQLLDKVMPDRKDPDDTAGEP